jgi:hypothetical protein
VVVVVVAGPAVCGMLLGGVGVMLMVVLVLVVLMVLVVVLTSPGRLAG